MILLKLGRGKSFCATWYIVINLTSICNHLQEIFIGVWNFFLVPRLSCLLCQRRAPQCAENRTAKTLYQKFETNIPRNETARLRSRFVNSFICKLLVHFHDRWWVYINRSQIHECGNWERGRTVSFLGIHKSDLVCSANEGHSLRQANNLTTGMIAYHNYH
jgi:hypothetical protein